MLVVIHAADPGFSFYVSLCSAFHIYPSSLSLFLQLSFLRFEFAYTHTMYYLAQVYKNLGESDPEL